MEHPQSRYNYKVLPLAATYLLSIPADRQQARHSGLRGAGRGDDTQTGNSDNSASVIIQYPRSGYWDGIEVLRNHMTCSLFYLRTKIQLRKLKRFHYSCPGERGEREGGCDPYSKMLCSLTTTIFQDHIDDYRDFQECFSS